MFSDNICGRPMTAPTGCFGFSTKTNGEHGSPLQYKNNKTAVQIICCTAV